ncbi:TIGR02450 family Trp-rich protein [Thalassotalea euphylliae]|uniref:TIGR02450 family Trp-rich protein n=1 Tax=Thalassotalea euphylliae TaxID=1655234 RepID=A0A3E0TM71_9GAMM|nr:TIGR02450 family Trp-rich protein [Thalassotalea euphylliae]REL25145.1 TIGR02450 family Trp-rich protein [Thalassotalea euphylliae]
MNQVAPRKLLHSKWTHTQPVKKEKHFAVINVEFDDDGKVTLCEIQAVMTNNIRAINWRDLKDAAKWRQGWQ